MSTPASAATRPAETFSPVEVERISGLSSEDLLWYEELGLIDSVSREPGGQRVYSASNLRWLEFLNRLRSTGMPVQEMGHYVELAQAGDHTVGERRDLLAGHRRRVLAHAEELAATVHYLDWQIDFYEKKRTALATGPGHTEAD
ncbi:MerR family transcriptional regulator [Kitasatospora indigofera]|uniref:MerR family transcriptional regulator n=1 Tax=Kitasatospora indigofera TaxID=67307 RepID=A0A919GG81_9ACTN|nr:MerR family transcriptional regulator [Kitasatospora indigofera]GHH83766.1 MerR family transcriptional regulator [Kitasatospora indigofera]